MTNWTERLFEQDFYLTKASATIVDVTADCLVLDRSIFYAESGGQPGDTGTLRLPSGQALAVADTRYIPGRMRIAHRIDGAPDPSMIGQQVEMEIDWARRLGHMRMHTALHILCGLITAPVTGCSMHTDRARLDFDLPDSPPRKEELTERLNAMLATGAAVEILIRERTALSEDPGLVRTANVAPPSLGETVRLVRVGAIDVQPCGGTHVRSTSEILPLIVRKVENRGKRNRRIEVCLAGE